MITSQKKITYVLKKLDQANSWQLILFLPNSEKTIKLFESNLMLKVFSRLLVDSGNVTRYFRGNDVKVARNLLFPREFENHFHDLMRNLIEDFNHE